MRLFVADLPQPLLSRRTILVQGNEDPLLDLSRVIRSVPLPPGECGSYLRSDAGGWTIPRVLSLICNQQPLGREKIAHFVSQALEARQESSQGGAGVYHLRNLVLRKPIEPGSKVIIAGYRDPASRIPVGTTGERITGFLKFASALADPGARIRLPGPGTFFDADAALGVVIGKRAERIPASGALAFVAGYTLLVDITDRQTFQEECRTNNNLLAKNHQSLSPLGPCLWIPGDGQIDRKTEVILRLNGQVRQQFILENFSYGIEEMVSAWSRLILEPGDVLGLGAVIAKPRPGTHFESPVPVQPGDLLEVESAPIGLLKVEIADPNHEGRRIDHALCHF